MLQKQWVLRDVDPTHSQSLAKTLAIFPITAKVLLGRGVVDPENARSWIYPSREHGHDPFLLPDMEKAIDRIHRAINDRERMCFYGDYDVDGISATSLHLKFFSQFGAESSMYIPDRFSEGYGLNEKAVHQLAHEGTKVLVTADCGTSSHHEIEIANRLGIDVIVTDHHQIHAGHPDGFAFLNPQRSDSKYPFDGLCSGGLAYKVAEAYFLKYRDRGIPVESFRDLVALSTVADMVPLQDENRSLVRDGLARLSEGTRCGIRALKQKLGVEGVCTASTVGFRLAPVINAAGRLAHARLGVQLLTTESHDEAVSLAQRLEQLNRERRDIEHGIFEEAKRFAEESSVESAVVVGARNWHVGVVGIVASRLVECFHCPAVVVAFDQHGVGRGSVRSLPGLDVCSLLSQCGDLVEKFGGHAAAAGLVIREDRLHTFRERFQYLNARALRSLNYRPVLDIDAQVLLGDIHPRLVKELDHLHPFGLGNPEPTFWASGLKVLDKRLVGDDHLKLVVRHDGAAPFEGIGFRMGKYLSALSTSVGTIDLAFVPEMNYWKGYQRVQLRIRDIRVTQPDKDIPCH